MTSCSSTERIFSLVCFNYRILEIIPDESSLNNFGSCMPLLLPLLLPPTTSPILFNCCWLSTEQQILWSAFYICFFFVTFLSQSVSRIEPCISGNHPIQVGWEIQKNSHPSYHREKGEETHVVSELRNPRLCVIKFRTSKLLLMSPLPSLNRQTEKLSQEALESLPWNKAKGKQGTNRN